ncbi:MFS transporter [Clostridium sp. JNZ J1-5]
MKEFIVIWIGQLISSIGSGIIAFAVAIYVYQSTGSATFVSLAALLAFLPTILLNPAGGVLADRYDRRFMMILGDSLSALGLLFMLISIQTSHRGITPIFIGVTIIGSVITQSGFIMAYAVCGALADYVFGPMLMEGGILAGNVGKLIGIGEGREIGFMLIIAGIIMLVFAFIFSSKKNIYEIEGSIR